MTPPIRVDFHCHSTCSDGTLSPEALAERLAGAGVVFAALADHDTLEGLDAFRNRLTRLGVGCLSGVEITARFHGREAHLLAYGFDPDHPELRATLTAIRLSRLKLARGVIQPTPDGGLEIADAIAIVHRAGGSAYLAHPLVLEPEAARLEALLPELKAAGLDGLEALYSPARPEDQTALCEMARRVGLRVCAGTDFHHSAADSPAAGIDMPADLWKAFRDSVLSGAHRSARPSDERTALFRPRRINFVIRIVIPAVITLILFAVSLVGIILPAFERSLLERKQEMIRELVNSAWGILAEADEEARLGLIPVEKSQELARRRIAMLRYGRDGKDYFWLQDMHPRIVMHPYRPELVGQDVSDFRDPRGVRIFVEFADLVRRQEEGFIRYVWQWKDDPNRLVPKQSYIRGFKPWGWIIGTGMYIEDVKAEIDLFERHLVRISAGIAGLIALLLLTVIRQSLNLEHKRREAEDRLHESKERYRLLVEAASEGTLLVVDRRCRYANPTLLRRLGYTGHEIELLELSDLLPDRPGNERAWDIVLHLRQGEDHPGGIEAVLQRRDGRLFECLLAFSRLSYAGRDGLIIQARDITPRREPGDGQTGDHDEHDRQLAEAAANVPVGLFRARALPRAAVLEANRAAIELLPALGVSPGGVPLSLAEVFSDAEAFEDFLRRLERDGTARQRLHPPAATGPDRTLTLDARLVRDEAGAPRYIDGRIEDTTAEAGREAERESLIERLQSSLVYLHEPVDRLCHRPCFCAADTPVCEAAALMTAQDSEAALVLGENGGLAGIVTDRMLRARIVSESGNLREPVRSVLRDSVITIPRHALVYEALLLMQEKGVEHLAVTDDGGSIVGLLHSRDILQLHSSEAAVLTRKIADAATAEEAIRWCRRAPVLVRALVDSGAHPRKVTLMITAICDAATRRFLALAEAMQGPAPCPFVFLSLGSQGRREMSLFADQDNAILYDSGPDDPAPDAWGRYFLNLGQQVCAWLDAAGYPFCRGLTMARNPKWCASLSTWRRVVTEWIHNPEPQQVLESAMFLDFRAVYGQEELARSLRHHVHETLQKNPAFLPFLARNLLSFQPPATALVRRLRPWRTAANLIDMKSVLMPLIGMARVYALRHQLDETHTLDRLEALARRALITEGNLREIAVSCELLLRLRLNHQAECLREGRPLNNTIDWSRLTRLEQAQLDQAFHCIRATQKKISFDFLGGI